MSEPGKQKGPCHNRSYTIGALFIWNFKKIVPRDRRWEWFPEVTGLVGGQYMVRSKRDAEIILKSSCRSAFPYQSASLNPGCVLQDPAPCGQIWWGKPWRISPEFWSLAPNWKNRVGFLAPDLSLALWSSGKWTSRSKLSLALPLSHQ